MQLSYENAYRIVRVGCVLYMLALPAIEKMKEKKKARKAYKKAVAEINDDDAYRKLCESMQDSF